MIVDPKHALKVMDAAWAVYLATASANGPRVRALVNLRRRWRYRKPSRTARADGFTVYLATALNSDKAREIAADPRVSVYYAQPFFFRGVMLSGMAEILHDQPLKDALWSDDWHIYWSDGPSNPDYIVIRVVPSDIRGWWGSKPFAIDVP